MLTMSRTQSEGLLAPRSSRTRTSMVRIGSRIGHFGGFAGRVVAGLDFFEEFAVVAEEAGVAADDQFFERGDGEVRFPDAGRAHEEEAFVGAAGKIAGEGFGVAFGELEGLRVLRGPGFTVDEIGNVAFEVAMFVALGDVRALEHEIVRDLPCRNRRRRQIYLCRRGGKSVSIRCRGRVGNFLGAMCRSRTRRTEYEGGGKTASGAVDDL